MVFREVSVIEIREVLRAGCGVGIAEGGPAGGRGPQDRASLCGRGGAAGLDRDGGAGQLTDELLGQVMAAVRPARPQGYGAGVGGRRRASTSRSRVGEAGPDGGQDRDSAGASGRGGVVPDAAPVLRGAHRLSWSWRGDDGAGGRRRAGCGVSDRFRQAGFDPRCRGPGGGGWCTR